MNNREQLIDIMVERGLERREIAELLSVDRDTVDHWLLPQESHRRVDIPDMAIELLQLKLAMQADDPPDPGA